MVNRKFDNHSEEVYLLPFLQCQYLLGNHLEAVQSVKLSVGQLSRNRYYVSFNKHEGKTAREALGIFSQKIHMPESATVYVRSLLDQFYIWSIGVAEDRTILYYKLYLMSMDPESDTPIISVEWKPGGSHRFLVKNYKKEKWKKPYELRQLVRHTLFNHAGRPREIHMERLYEECFCVLDKTSEPIETLTVSEKGNSRLSIDFNLGRTYSVTIEDLRPHIDAISDVFAVPEEEYFAWLADFSVTGIGHFAVGLDSRQYPFVTLYGSAAAAAPHPYVYKPGI